MTRCAHPRPATRASCRRQGTPFLSSPKSRQQPAAGAKAVNVDVGIVGAGPVGLLLANLLGALGLRVDVYEKRLVPPTDSMAIGITPPSLEILRELGLDRTFVEAGVPVRHAEVYERSFRVGRLDFSSINSEYPYFLSLPQARTIELLRANLAQFPQVTVRVGYEFAGRREDADGVQAEFRRILDGTLQRHRCRFLVGADGHRSAVRQAAGIRVRERIYPQRFIMADFPDESRLGPEARLFFTPEASVESFPLPDAYRRWIVQRDPQAKAMPAELEFLIRTVRRLTGFELQPEGVRLVSAFGAKRMIVEQYHRGRVILVGDAAHVMSSIGGQGMNTGLADAEMLAETLAQVLSDPARSFRCFTAYEQLRRRSFEVAANRAERGMWLGTLRGPAASWCRKQFIRHVLFSPWLRHRLAPHFAMLTIPYRNLRSRRHARRALS